MEIIWLSLSTSLISLIFLLMIFNVFLQRRKAHYHLPPSPPAIRTFGNLHLLNPPLIYRQFENLSHKYGPVFSLRFGSRLVVVISSPSAVEECFTKNDMVFANRPFSLPGKYIACKHWHNLRRLRGLEIFSMNRLDMFRGVHRDEINILVRRLSRNSIGDDFARVELRPMFTALTYNIILRMVVGKSWYGEEVETAEAKRFQKILREISELSWTGNAGDFLPSMGWFDHYGVYEKKLMKINAEKDAILQGFIDEHRSHDRDRLNKNSLIHYLLSLQKSEPEYYTDEIIKGLVLDLTFAGTNTTATTIEWAISLLLNHPDVLVKVRVELDTQVGKDRLMEESDFPKLRYLQSIISETLRLFPPAPILLPHISSNNCQISGFYIPRGTILFVNAWVIHRDHKLWEDATSFKPERFEKVGGESEILYKLLPFGVGRRACPAVGLVDRLLGLAIGSLIQCYEWKRVSDKEVDLTEGKGITMTKLQPLEAMCKARAIVKKVLQNN